jgi:hypothetical protein
MARLFTMWHTCLAPPHIAVYVQLVIGVFTPAEFAAAGIPIFNSSRAHVADTGKVFLEEGAPAAVGAV